ncbi:MAG: arginine--tRNA ligase, partial [Candidatus Omnitrophica bacterium CG12_big_fil_rev_8_21_14_0_65_50_5]
MLDQINQSIRIILSEALKSIVPDGAEFPTVDLEIPSDASNGDFASNLALKSAKILRKNPAEIAGELAQLVERCIRNSPELKGAIA